MYLSQVCEDTDHGEGEENLLSMYRLRDFIHVVKEQVMQEELSLQPWMGKDAQSD